MASRATTEKPEGTTGQPPMEVRVLEHVDGLICGLETLRKENTMCDAILVVGKQEFPVHRNVLASCSLYFRKLFTSPMRDTYQEKFPIAEISQPEVMEHVLQFVYTGNNMTSDLTVNATKELVKAADYLLLEPLKKVCCAHLEDEMNVENCLSIYKLATKYNCLELNSYTEDYIKECFADVSKEPEFVDLEEDELKGLISSVNTSVKKEEQVFVALMRWTKANPEERNNSFPQLFNLIRLSSMYKNYLSQVVAREELVTQNQCCMLRVLDALGTCTFTIDVVTEDLKPRICQDDLSNVIVVCGGQLNSDPSRYTCNPTNSLLFFDPLKSQWYDSRRLAKMKTSRKAYGAAWHDGFLFVAGGRSDTKHSCWRNGPFELLSSVERYEPKLNVWERVAPLPKTVCGGMVSLCGSLYFAGCVDNSSTVIPSCCKVFEYKHEINDWNDCSGMKGHREGQTIVTDGTSIFVIGGRQSAADGDDATDDGNQTLKITSKCEKFDIVLQSWEPISSLKLARAYACGACCDGKIYIVSGLQVHVGEMPSITKTCEVYTIETGCWTSIANIPTSRIGAGMTCLSGKLYVIGGEDVDDNAVSTVECYDTETDQWSTLEPMPQARKYIQACAIRVPIRFLMRLK